MRGNSIARWLCVPLLCLMTEARGQLVGQVAMRADRGDGSEIYTLDLKTGDVRNVTNVNWAADSLPDWSPDGRRIAFKSTRDPRDGEELFVMNADGTGQTNVTNTVGYESHPAWSPNGKRIAFSSARHGAMTMDPDGGNVELLTGHPGGDYEPDWSPDSARLVFTSGREPSGVYTIGADGLDAKLLVAGGGQPSWSPDGEHIAFITWDGVAGHSFLHVMDLTRGRARRVDTGALFHGRPTWSPDGQHIMYASQNPRDKLVAGLYVVEADGDRPLAVPGGEQASEASWLGPRGLGVGPLHIAPAVWGWLKGSRR